MTISKAGFIAAAQDIGCEVEAVMAVARVESSGAGFDPEGFPRTLFEGHWFHRYTNGKFAASNPTLCYPKWTKQFYGKSWQEEKARLSQAIALDKTSAMLSASWGMFQIMGFNFSKCGYKTVQQFVNDMCKSEDSQLLIFTDYVKNAGLADELRDKRWADFARLYNGPEYAQNKYDTKLQAAYAAAKAS
jgi:hypothetical protein